MLEGVEDMALLYTRVDGNLNFQVTQMTYQQVQEDPYAALLEAAWPFRTQVDEPAITYG